MTRAAVFLRLAASVLIGVLVIPVRPPAFADIVSEDTNNRIPIPRARPAEFSDRDTKPIVQPARSSFKKRPIQGLSEIPKSAAPPDPSCEGLDAGGLIVERVAPVVGENGCGIAEPVRLTGIHADGAISLSAPAVTNCAMARRIGTFIRQDVAPAARDILGSDLTGLTVAASYVCRSRNSQSGTKLSEHATGNALDIAAFHVADGRVVDVENDWQAGGELAAFLRRIHKAACDRFTTVIGPDGDEWHRDHIHLDLGRHGKTGRYRICQ